ncbi:hypothetical protein CGX12_18480 [Zobellella denitrificans]|jgi:hypothetical protein|uniref:hypothetical protein n=1 Tax=Zobellella denitrificans TaxID=347534 RepID=UPI000B8C04A6|nr:hypothetical protein [Zobellella denitrificans]OXS13668.1 hypothetical protein CGX12_18480 [Zobellella denitrificans]
MAFRKPITTLGGLMWWTNIRQDKYFIMQEHKVGLPAWPYKYRITLRENRMEIANSNDPEEIDMDWEYLKENIVPQLDKKIDIGDAISSIDWVELINAGIKKI